MMLDGRRLAVNGLELRLEERESGTEEPSPGDLLYHLFKVWVSSRGNRVIENAP